MKRYLIILFALVLFCGKVNSQELQQGISPEMEYLLLLSDIENSNVYGYKSQSLYRPEIGGTDEINFSQGYLIETNRPLDFAIGTDGFFKIVLENNEIGYTRSGEFTINEQTNKLITIDGYRLFDNIIINPGFINLIVSEDNSIITSYSLNMDITTLMEEWAKKIISPKPKNGD